MRSILCRLRKFIFKAFSMLLLGLSLSYSVYADPPNYSIHALRLYLSYLQSAPAEEIFGFFDDPDSENARKIFEKLRQDYLPIRSGLSDKQLELLGEIHNELGRKYRRLDERMVPFLRKFYRRIEMGFYPQPSYLVQIIAEELDESLPSSLRADARERLVQGLKERLIGLLHWSQDEADTLDKAVGRIKNFKKFEEYVSSVTARFEGRPSQNIRGILLQNVSLPGLLEFMPLSEEEVFRVAESTLSLESGDAFRFVINDQQTQRSRSRLALRVIESMEERLTPFLASEDMAEVSAAGTTRGAVFNTLEEVRLSTHYGIVEMGRNANTPYAYAFVAHYVEDNVMNKKDRKKIYQDLAKRHPEMAGRAFYKSMASRHTFFSRYNARVIGFCIYKFIRRWTF